MNTRAWIVFLDESGVSLLPQIRRTYSPRGRTPLLRHRLNRKRASMAGALGYHSTDPHRGARLCFHLKPGSYDTTGLIEVLEQMKVFYRGERVVLVRDGLSAHWSRAMRAWVAEQDWLTLDEAAMSCSRQGWGKSSAVAWRSRPPRSRAWPGYRPPGSSSAPRTHCWTARRRRPATGTSAHR
ncbi:MULTISPECIES: transposase [unclassified Streptomyces]|uniref:transposase n=1 Tax=unclassified Streptomyces TaxID=2593676 RepID=UPI00224D7435|nr:MULTISPECIES: transposase [unclassified Streptomyces]MCX4869457.1 transposase [Streptomyces sp. NBC_00906]MCX4900696.1 transposase [Streptomyces sp. NBC_00892]